MTPSSLRRYVLGPTALTRTLLTTLLLSLIFAATWLAYSPGFSSALQFDDPPNLSELADIDSTLDALSFITEGQSGPLGRPLSLATFVAQRQHWPRNLETLFQTNVALHIGTGVAVFFLALGLSRALRFPGARWVAVLTATLWLLSPFLASTPLILVQRMAVLAGFFMFSGLAAYVWGRVLFDRAHRIGLVLVISGLGLCTLFGMLSKENAILLPVLALVIELTILRKSIPINSRTLRLAQLLLIGLPVALITVYLSMRIPGLFSDHGHRDFTRFERLASQPQILLEYVRHLLLPTTEFATPFTDDRRAVRGWENGWVTLISVAAWLGAMSIAVRVRRWSPIPLFGLLFFLAGHGLESTIIYLELYYAHRNYVPAFGVYFVLAFGLVYAARMRPKIIIPGIAAYVLLFASVLFSTSSLWGQPRVAGEIWALQHPDSTRAQQFLAREYAEMGDYLTAQKVLTRGAGSDDSGSMAVQVLQTCAFDEPRGPSAATSVQRAAAEIGAGRLSNSMGLVILNLTVHVLDGHCDDLSVGDLNLLIQAVLRNPAYQSNTPIQIRLINAKALIAQSQGDWALATEHVREMYALSRHANHARVYSELLLVQGHPEEALAFLFAAKEDVSMNPLKRWIRERIINEQIIAIQTSTRNSE